jgi:hypothetical protein
MRGCPIRAGRIARNRCTWSGQPAAGPVRPEPMRGGDDNRARPLDRTAGRMNPRPSSGALNIGARACNRPGGRMLPCPRRAACNA